MLTRPPIELLQPGDLLLYAGRGLFSWVIRTKTWSDVSHLEVYDGGGFSLASRDGEGVERFPLRLNDLYAVLRPNAPFDFPAGRTWFATVRGQGYDWIGLLSFYFARFRGKENGKQFCSEFATRFFRAAGLDLFPRRDADAVAPGEFLSNPLLTLIWRRPKEA
jgi:hypothetical protein